MSSSRIRLLVVIALPALALLSGCSTPPELTSIRLPAADYDATFDAAIEVAREHGLEPSIRDRRGGVIETDPDDAPSLLEPWRADPGTFQSRVDQTTQFLRRRARIEFTPVSPEPSEPGPEPDLLGLGAARGDLSTLAAGDLEVRVSVFVEQSHQPGLRRSTWSRRATSRSVVYPPGAYDRPLPTQFWTPTERDPRFEASILAALAERAGEGDEG